MFRCEASTRGGVSGVSVGGPVCPDGGGRCGWGAAASCDGVVFACGTGSSSASSIGISMAVSDGGNGGGGSGFRFGSGLGFGGVGFGGSGFGGSGAGSGGGGARGAGVGGTMTSDGTSTPCMVGCTSSERLCSSACVAHATTPTCSARITAKVEPRSVALTAELRLVGGYRIAKKLPTSVVGLGDSCIALVVL